jgi:hypothetical protein
LNIFSFLPPAQIPPPYFHHLSRRTSLEDEEEVVGGHVNAFDEDKPIRRREPFRLIAESRVTTPTEMD